MEQKDLFLKQLDQFGRALAGVLARLTNSDYSASAATKMEEVNEVLNEHLSISLNELLSITSESFINELKNKHKLDESNFEKLADLLELSAENIEKPQLAYSKALVLQEYMQRNSKDFSFQRQGIIDRLKKLTS